MNKLLEETVMYINNNKPFMPPFYEFTVNKVEMLEAVELYKGNSISYGIVGKRDIMQHVLKYRDILELSVLAIMDKSNEFIISFDSVGDMYIEIKIDREDT